MFFFGKYCVFKIIILKKITFNRYMQFILPRAEWDNDALRAALVQILRRLDKVFLKISKKPSIRVRRGKWDSIF